MSIFKECTIAPAAKRPLFVTLSIAFVAVLLVSVAPVFLKKCIDALIAGESGFTAIFAALMVLTYTVGSVLHELKWIFYTRADRANYHAHIALVLHQHPHASALRMHRAALSNSRYLAIILLTALPITAEMIISANMLTIITHPLLAATLLMGCSLQLVMVLRRSHKLDPLFTQSKETEHTYFQTLESGAKNKGSLVSSLNKWYDSITAISQARYRMRMASLLPIMIAMGIANWLALSGWRQDITPGAIAALNSYFIQISASIEMLGNSMREALLARNQMRIEPDSESGINTVKT